MPALNPRTNGWFVLKASLCLLVLAIPKAAYSQNPDPATFDPTKFDPTTFKVDQFKPEQFDPKTWDPDKLHGFFAKLKDADLAAVLKKLGKQKGIEAISRAGKDQVFDLRTLTQARYNELKPAFASGKVIVFRISKDAGPTAPGVPLTSNGFDTLVSASDRVRSYGERAFTVDGAFDWIKTGGGAIGGVLVALPIGQLGDYLSKLDPSQLADQIKNLNPQELGEVFKKLDPADLGKTLKNLGAGDVAANLVRLEPGALIDTLDRIPNKIAGTIKNQVGNLEKKIGDAGEIFSKLNENQLGDIFTKAGNLPVSKMLGRFSSDTFKVILDKLTKLDPTKFDPHTWIQWEMIIPTNIPWDQFPPNFDIRKLPWEKLDPRQIPWEKVDPSRVDWSKADPTQKAKEAGGWFSDRAKETGAQAKALGDQISQVPGLNPADLQKRLSQARDELGRVGAKLDEATRTNIGRFVEAVKDSPIYKRIIEFLLPFTKIVLFDLTNDLKIKFNFTSGAYSFKVQVAPGLTLKDSDIEDLIAGNPSVPTPDYEQLAFAALGYREQTSTNYRSVRDELLKRFGRTDVYVVSEEFIEFFSLENAAKEGVTIFLTGDSRSLIQRGKRIIRNEGDQIYIWLENHAKDKADAYFRDIGAKMLETAITGRPFDAAGLPVKLKLEPITIAYKYEYVPAGLTKMAADLIRQGAKQAGIDLNEKWANISFQINHPAFATIWDDGPQQSNYLEQMVQQFNQRKQSHVNDLQSRFDVVKQAVQRAITASPIKDSTGIMNDVINGILNGNIDSFVEKKLQDKLFETLGIDGASLPQRIVPGSPLLDLRGTPIEGQVMDKVGKLALGNESTVSIQELTLDLNTYTLTAVIAIRHREVLDILGIFENLLDRFTSILRKVANAAPNQPTRDAMDAAKTNYEQEKRQAETAPDGGADIARRTTRGKLLWHLTEQPAIQSIGATQFPGAEPAYYVSGMLSSLSSARREAFELSNRLQRPINLVYNPSWINTETDPAVFPGVLPNQTGTPEQLTDLTEAIYDRTWPEFVTQYLARITSGGVRVDGQVVGGFEELIDAVGTSHARSWRLQENPTTRQVAHILFNSARPVTIISNNQGSIIVRNACHSAALLGKEEFIRNHLRWVDCGGVLASSEITPRPCSYLPLIHSEDLSGPYLGLKRKFDASEQDRLDNPTRPGTVAGFGLSLYLEALNSIEVFFRPQGDQCSSTALPFAADANGDKKADLWAACVRNSGCGTYVVESMVCHLVDGAAGTSSAPYLRIVAPFGRIAGTPFVADFNGDGFADIALFIPCRVVSASVRTTGGWLVRRGDGRGGFEQLHYVQNITGKNDIGWDPCWVRVGDVNGDGKADLVSYDATQNEWRVQVLSKDLAFTSFDNGRFISNGRTMTPSDFQVADINGDGKDDIILCRTFTHRYSFRRLCRVICRSFTTRSTEFHLASDRIPQPSGAIFPVTPSGNLTCCFGANVIFGDWNGDRKSDFGIANLIRCDCSPISYRLDLVPSFNESDPTLLSYCFTYKGQVWSIKFSCCEIPCHAVCPSSCVEVLPNCIERCGRSCRPLLLLRKLCGKR